MTEVPMKNAPQLWGWAMASGIAAVAFGAAYVAVGMSSAGSIAVASVLFLVVGLMLGLPARDEADAPAPAEPKVMTPSMLVARMDAATEASVEASTAAKVARTDAVTEVAEVVAGPVQSTMSVKPQGLTAARNGQADDLKLIKGIGPKLEELCHRLGYYHFDQIAAWTPAEIAWVDDNLEGFKGRVTRDSWVAQARALSGGGMSA